MKLKSAAGTVCYVSNLDKTVEFYEKLGFQFKTRDPERATAYLNWWWFDFHQADAPDAPAWHVSAKVNNAKIGALFYFSVENVQNAYQEVVASGLQPASEPIELRGSREFGLLDPDGYRLVFFKRQVSTASGPQNRAGPGGGGPGRPISTRLRPRFFAR